MGMTDLTPWLTHDLAAQEKAGEVEGRSHCLQGWCVDSSDADTPFMRGYRRGWDGCNKEGLHSTQPKIRRPGLPPFDPSYV